MLYRICIITLFITFLLSFGHPLLAADSEDTPPPSDPQSEQDTESSIDKDEEVSEEDIAKTAEQLYKEAHDFLKDERFTKAIEAYQTLQIRFPFSREATQAQLDVSYAYQKEGDSEAALATLDRFVKMHPTHPNIDYAYYLRGLVNFNRSSGFLQRFVPSDDSQRDVSPLSDAHDNFVDLLERFPDTRYREDAGKRMIELRNKLAKHELHVARYYMKRKAYVAAVRRAAKVLEDYPRSTAIPNALKILQKAYKKLDLKHLSADTKRIYALNYPDGVPQSSRETSAAEDVWNFLGLDED